MGIRVCIINVEAIMIEELDRIWNLRVAIIDTDCHQRRRGRISMDDPDTCYILSGWKAISGYNMDELGGPSAFGYNLNIPLPPGTVMRALCMSLILVLLFGYKPDRLSTRDQTTITRTFSQYEFYGQGICRAEP